MKTFEFNSKEYYQYYYPNTQENDVFAPTDQKDYNDLYSACPAAKCQSSALEINEQREKEKVKAATIGLTLQMQGLYNQMIAPTLFTRVKFYIEETVKLLPSITIIDNSYDNSWGSNNTEIHHHHHNNNSNNNNNNSNNNENRRESNKQDDRLFLGMVVGISAIGFCVFAYLSGKSFGTLADSNNKLDNLNASIKKWDEYKEGAYDAEHKDYRKAVDEGTAVAKSIRERCSSDAMFDFVARVVTAAAFLTLGTGALAASSTVMIVGGYAVLFATIAILFKSGMDSINSSSDIRKLGECLETIKECNPEYKPKVPTWEQVNNNN